MWGEGEPVVIPARFTKDVRADFRAQNRLCVTKMSLTRRSMRGASRLRSPRDPRKARDRRRDRDGAWCRDKYGFAGCLGRLKLYGRSVQFSFYLVPEEPPWA